jgi:dTDP-glucose 4,6-dehydratase
MRTVLVTGGCGFIGSHFIRLLLQRTEWRIINLDKLTYAGRLENLSGVTDGPRYRFVRGDIADRAQVDDLFREERLWGIVNFAAESHVDRSILDSAPFLLTNVIGVQTLLEAARRHGIERFLQISTDEVYGDAAAGAPFSEESALSPSSPYAASKAAADLLCLAYRRTYGLPTLIVRASNNYGPCQFPEKLIPLMIRNALREDELPIYGDGLQRRDWLYVEDNVEAILAVLDRGQVGAIYNVAAGEERSNLVVVEGICELLGARLKVNPEAFLPRLRHVKERPGHDRRYAITTCRVREELGWAPRVSFAEGLARTVGWFLQHRESLTPVVAEDYRLYCEAVYARSWEPSP